MPSTPTTITYPWAEFIIGLKEDLCDKARYDLIRATEKYAENTPEWVTAYYENRIAHDDIRSFRIFMLKTYRHEMIADKNKRLQNNPCKTRNDALGYL